MNDLARNLDTWNDRFAEADADAPAWPDGGPFDPAAAHRAEMEADAALVTELDAPPIMLDWEAASIAKHIRDTQTDIANTDADAKRIKAQKAADLRKHLWDFERLARFSAWVSSALRGANRQSMTLLGAGTVGETHVKAKCIVGDKGLALPWLKANHPQAVVEVIDANKLPAPKLVIDTTTGERQWVAPGPGLIAIPARDELTVDGKMVSVLLRKADDAMEDSIDEVD